MIQYVSPFVVEDIDRRDEVLANGFFLKHLAYEPSKADIAIAPFFVLHSMHVYTPQEDRTWQALLLGFAVLMIVLGRVEPACGLDRGHHRRV